MPDDAELTGLNPHDLMDREAQRLDAFFSQLDEEAWQAASVCGGWSVHDVLSHLAGSEEYNLACLADSIGPLMEQYGARGVTDVDSFNALGVQDRADRSHEEVLEEWRAANAQTRQGLRAVGDGTIPTFVGPYPATWQAWHLASELATHADDVGVPVDESEAAARLDWRARFSRFALAEVRPELPIDHGPEGTTVVVGGRSIVLDDATLVAAAAARLKPGALDEEARRTLSTVG
jgi:uncharacterized protein (TIGR03083 family)